MSSLVQLLALLAFSSFCLAQNCHFPNGGIAGADTPCNPNLSVSSCCFTGQACLSNGLCVSDPHNPTAARLHRGTCTDQNWKSGNCPRHCTDIANNGVPVYSCNQTNTDSYCCYDNCQCTNQFEHFSFADAPYTITIIGEEFTNTHTATPSPTSSAGSTAVLSSSGSLPASTSITGVTLTSAIPTSTPTPQTAEKHSSNSTAIGVGVGVGVGAALLIGTGIFFFLRRRRNSRNPYTTGTLVEAPANEYAPPTKFAYNEHNSIASPPPELPTESVDPVELPSAPPPKTS